MLFPFGFSGQNMRIYVMFHTCYIPHPPPFYHPNILWWRDIKRVASLCIISALSPLTPDIPLSILLADSHSFYLNLRDQAPHPLKGRVVLKFQTSSGGHYEVKEVTVSCHISGSHSGVVVESCVLVRRFVSLGLYRYAPHNDASVNDGPHIRRWSRKIIIL
jgi:hypothetical protein